MTLQEADDFDAKLSEMKAQHEAYRAIIKDKRTPTQAEEDAEDAAWAALLALAEQLF
jgi:hypothetical protein